MKTTEQKITRDEAKKRAACIAKVVPGATVRLNAWNVTVISRSGKHLACWTGRRDGFRRAQ